MKTPKTIELKIVPIGNSRGVRLPKEIIERYAIEDSIVLEAHEDTLVFRSVGDAARIRPGPGNVRRVGWRMVDINMALWEYGP